ncbi:MAG: hypothetical protein GY928_02830 [Colwellia sp.]|nr:hypothetical protein [Colwellia sp.]
MREGLNLALIKIGRKLETDGKQKHRYERRSGKLIADTGYKITKSKLGFLLNFGLGFDPTNAARKYGKSVHEGHGTWKPDQFIYKAVKKNKLFIDNEINKAIKKVTKKV